MTFLKKTSNMNSNELTLKVKKVICKKKKKWISKSTLLLDSFLPEESTCLDFAGICPEKIELKIVKKILYSSNIKPNMSIRISKPK